MRVVAAALVLALSVAGCARMAVKTTAVDPGAVDTSALWERVDPATRDLFHGPGGPELVPDAAAPFAMIAADRSGYSAGYDVRDARGREWSVKLGPEAQTEVVVSRLLWAIGFHQPPTYYVPQWRMTGERAGLQGAARFRPEIESWREVGEWSWYENDFIDTPAFRQLLAANVLLNNWDWKTSNNRVYQVDGRELFVVRDLGASLGRTAYPRLLFWMPTQAVAQGSRNDIEDFEEQGFIRRVTEEGVDFDYRGLHGKLLERLRAEDVVRTTQLFAGLSRMQLDDAFRAAGYEPDVRARYVAKITSKIAEGLKLAP